VKIVGKNLEVPIWSYNETNDTLQWDCL